MLVDVSIAASAVVDVDGSRLFKGVVAIVDVSHAVGAVFVVHVFFVVVKIVLVAVIVGFVIVVVGNVTSGIFS